MTTELEQEFFKVFGIKPQKLCFNGDCVAKDEIGYDEKICDDRCVYIERKYPEITYRKLLQMICIVMKYKNTYRFVNGIEDFKKQTFKILISLKDMLSIYAEIQQLFKGGE